MKPNQTDAERLEQFVNSKKLSTYEFAKRIGTTSGRLYHVLNGRVSLSRALIEQIKQAYPDTDTAWLLTGKGSPPEPVKEPEPKIEVGKVTDKEVFKRLLYFKKQKGLTFEQLAEPLLDDIGVEGLKIAIKRERTEKEYIDRIIKFHDIDESWLINGEGEMFKKENPKAEISSPARIEHKSIPIYNFEVAASDMTLYNDNHIEIIGRLSIPGVTENAEKAVVVAGHSMHPIYPAGSYIALRQITEFHTMFVPGLAYVVETDEQEVFKYLKIDENNPDQFIAVSENKHYQDFPIPKSAIRKLWLVLGGSKKAAMG